MGKRERQRERARLRIMIVFFEEKKREGASAAEGFSYIGGEPLIN
jgi:hypothetical protein